MNNGPLRIICCPAAARPQAIRQLYEGLGDDQRAGLVEAIDAAQEANAEAWNGLLVAMDGDAITASMWIQPAAGRTAIVWPPSADAPGAEALLEAGGDLLDREGVRLAQILVSESDASDSSMLEGAGFPRLAELVYYYAEAASHPAESEKLPAGVQLQSRAGEQPQRLASLIERTYIDTLDCPGLDQARSLGDVLASYRAQGVHEPQQWYFVQRHGQDVGALLLTTHPGSGNWELVYMGLVPEARGAGLGRLLARQTRVLAQEGGAERVVTAVDANNMPALAAYQAAGYRVWDRRIVHARLDG